MKKYAISIICALGLALSVGAPILAQEQDEIEQIQAIEEVEEQEEENEQITTYEVIDYTEQLEKINNNVIALCVICSCSFLSKIYWEIHQQHD